MILSFADKETARLFQREWSRKIPSDIQRTALYKLRMIHAARALADLVVPPGNRLEKLLHDRLHRYSIRINDQWRICFRWQDGYAHDVEIIDYH
ncbi:type II toxin-antitoxin system RelE/ParE family toxin [Patescibacteria group bacterium]|nr:MAG: type II toxin-antitoxin system RelE/ParE family toxin [Patescibacteria group bacterium]